MLNVEVARKALGVLAPKDKQQRQAFQEVDAFITSVENLLKNNSIKQVPALFKPREKGS